MADGNWNTVDYATRANGCWAESRFWRAIDAETPALNSRGDRISRLVLIRFKNASTRGQVRNGLL